MLLNSLHYTGQPLQGKRNWFQTSTGLRLGNPGLGASQAKSESQIGFGIIKERSRRDAQGQNAQRTVHPKTEPYYALQTGAAAIDQLYPGLRHCWVPCCKLCLFFCAPARFYLPFSVEPSWELQLRSKSQMEMICRQ